MQPHQDGIITQATLKDGKTVEADGRYTHPDLVPLCRDLGLPG